MNPTIPRSRVAFTDLVLDEFRRLLATNGYVYMDGVPETFEHVEFLRQFGPLMPQYDGELIWSIKAEERFDDLYHSLNTKPLMPHTECYEFHGLPPKYLALWCLIPASDDGGQTTLADMYAFADELSDAEREHLSVQPYGFVSSAGVQDMRLGRTAHHPVLEKRSGLPDVVRFSYNCVDHGDDSFLLDVRERVVEFFDRSHVAIDMEPRSLLIWDNHRVVHSRTGYEDRRRHLRRVWLAES
ncbi:TauD/TfdA family dioxygenase [Frankia sp. CiP3]|uniref:TauD/TfdA family dioxygenase n=1 Tax=Frankia sp. CiP3 TaxID=2880971 RepID=UPI001EF658E6|nr:TauD/TfdA family dioxygenase [Frankia sp. CiP3]